MKTSICVRIKQITFHMIPSTETTIAVRRDTVKPIIVLLSGYLSFRYFCNLERPKLIPTLTPNKKKNKNKIKN